jgi:CPA2 family monovalent cation:H+ antiporter-2
MLLTLLLLRAAPAIALRLHRKPNQQVQLEEITALNAQLQGHAVICGYGRVGQSIGRFLRREQQAFIALDDDPERVQEAATDDSSVHYGDCRRGALLNAVGLERARGGDCRGQQRRGTGGAWEARRLNPTVPILVRTRDDSQLAELRRGRQRSGARALGVEPDARLPRLDHAGPTGPTGSGADR